VSSESENDVESEEEESTVLYPLEDKYIDEADKHRWVIQTQTTPAFTQIYCKA
jgi:hypothetical protein